MSWPSSYPRRRRQWRLGFGIAVFVVLAALLLGGCIVKKYLVTSTVTFTVTDKTASGGGSNGHKYLFYTNKGTFEDTDNILQGKTNSSDLYGQIKVGGTYTCTTTGFRLSLFSEYRNVLSCSAVK